MKAARTVRAGGRWKRTHTGNLASGLPELQHSNSAHPGGHFTVRLTLTPATLRVEVSDQGGPWAPGAGTDDQHGRGLHIVGQLATCWGTTPTDTGRTVWFTMTSPQAHTHTTGTGSTG